MNKLTVDFRADKKNPVWVHVWDYEEHKKDNDYRIALEVFVNGKIKCVVNYYRDEYLNNEEYETCIWNHHELLPEKKQVPYTVEELHDLGAREIKRPSGRYHIITDFIEEVIVFNKIYYTIYELVKNGCKWTSDTEAPFVWHPFVREV